MPSPFPGMDPYIERPAIWPDFHDTLIACIRGALQPLLRPRYVALTQDRLYLVESERPIRPDVAIMRRPTAERKSGGAVLEVDQPAVFQLWREEIREPLIHIVEPAEGNRVVTAIEILSPDNKKAGPGQKSYRRKRRELWKSKTNLVEIDLLRAGSTTVRVTSNKLEGLRPWHYLVAVTRCRPARQEVYAVPLQRRLPRVAIPLSGDDPDVPLDLQAVFTRCWDEGPYPELLHYEGPPPGTFSSEELGWCDTILRTAGLRDSAVTGP